MRRRVVLQKASEQVAECLRQAAEADARAEEAFRFIPANDRQTLPPAEQQSNRDVLEWFARVSERKERLAYHG